MAGLKKPEPENPVGTQHPEERRADKNLDGSRNTGRGRIRQTALAAAV